MISVDGKFKLQKVTGVQRYALEILNVWDKKSYKYQILTPNFKPIGLWEQTLRGSSSDLLWCPTNSAPLANRRKVVTLHDCAVFYNPSWFSKRYRYWRKFVIPKLASSSLGIITVSEFSKNVICSALGVSPDFVKVIPNGINTEFFHKIDEAEAHKLIDELKINKPYLLTVGSMDPRKNISSLLKAWDKFNRLSNEKYDLVVVGGSNQNFYNELNHNVKNVIFTGYVSDEELKAIYQNAHSFIYPSLFEGFGLPVLEAMTFGLPVLSSNSTALPEVGGESVLYFDPNSIDEILHAIIEITSNHSLHNQYSKYSLARVKKFSWDKCGGDTYSYLEGFL